MKKSILLIGYNFAPESTGIGKYSGEMIDWLANAGYACTVITTYPYYPHWKVQEPFLGKRFWYSSETQKYASGGYARVIRCPIYVPSKPSGLKRIVLDVSFFLSIIPVLIGHCFSKKSQNVMSVAPGFMVGIPALFYAGIRGSKFIYHIQDMQIEAAADLGMIKSERLIKLLFGLEKFILKKADFVTSISPEMVKRIEKKAGKKVHLFPNWSDTQRFRPLADQAAAKEMFGIDPETRVVLYSGGIGQKQGLDAILESALYHKNEPNLLFIICGSGPYSAQLEKLAIQMALTNLRFMPLQLLELFNAFLNAADVHLVIQKASAEDLMLPSKLTNILAVGGLAVITANQGTGLKNLVDQHHLGICVAPDSQAELNRAIELAVSNSPEVAKIRANALAYAKAYLDANEILSRFEHSILT